MKTGYSQKTVQANIAQLMAEGYDRQQAIAIALNAARRCFFKRYPQGALPSWLIPLSGRRLKNPVPPSSALESNRKLINQAARLYEDFTGHEAEHVETVAKPEIPGVALVIGTVDAIAYTTVRDGVQEKYIHEFKKSSRPLFTVTPDGKQIVILGGEYKFTDRGIVDGS